MAKAKRIGNVYAELSVRDKMSMTLKNAGRHLSEFGRKGLRVGAVAVGAVGAGLAVGTKRTIAMGAELDHLSTQTGIAVSSLMKLRQAYKDAGKSTDTLGTDVGTLQQRIYEAFKDPESSTNYFKDLGLSVQDLMNMSAEKQFFAVGEAIAKVGSKTKRTALAMQIFGDQGLALMSVFEKSSLEDVNESLGKMPEIMQEFSGAMERVDTLMGRLPNKSDQFFTGFTAGVIGELLPGLEKANEVDFTELGEKLGENVAFGLDGLTSGDLLEVAVLKAMAKFAKMGDMLASALKAGVESALESTEFQKLGAFLEGGLVELFGSEADKKAYADKVMQWHEAQALSPSKKFADAFKSKMAGAGLSSGIAEELERQADAIWNEQKKRTLKKREAAREVGAEMPGIPLISDIESVLAGLPQIRQAAADQMAADEQKKPDSKFDRLEASVNSMQARGLGMGGIYIAKEVKQQVDILERIHEELKRQTDKPEPGAVF